MRKVKSLVKQTTPIQIGSVPFANVTGVVIRIQTSDTGDSNFL